MKGRLAAALLLLASSAFGAEPPPPKGWTPGEKKALLLGSLFLGTLALQGVDSRVQVQMPDFVSDPSEHKTKLYNLGRPGSFFEQMGTATGALGTAAIFAGAGWAAGSPKAVWTGLEITEAFLVSGVAVTVIKEAAGRRRPIQGGGPDARRDADYYKPLGGDASFPSGHATTAFSIASVVAERYSQPWVCASAYGVASLVGWGRVIQNRHWTSDVLAGAILGYGSGKLVTGWNDHRRNLRVAVDPFQRRLVIEKRF